MSRPCAVATHLGLLLTAMLASADDAMQSRPVSLRSARFEVSWSQSRSQGPYTGGWSSLRSAAPAEFVTHPLAKPQVSAVRHGGTGEIA